MQPVIAKETCRFCNTYDPQITGTKICDCDDHCGYAHLKCFYAYVRETNRRKCDYCKKEWFVDKSQWKQYILERRHVTVWNRIREAASILLTLLVIFAMVMIWGFLIKVLIWMIYGAPNYILFGLPIFTSTGWTHFSVGDAVTGSIGAVCTILVAVVWVPIKSQCYRKCCIRRPRKKYNQVTQLRDMEGQGEDDDISDSGGELKSPSKDDLHDIENLVSMSESRALEHSRSMIKSFSSVELAPASDDDE